MSGNITIKEFEDEFDKMYKDKTEALNTLRGLLMYNINHFRLFYSSILSISAIFGAGFLTAFITNQKLIKSSSSVLLGIILLFLNIFLIVTYSKNSLSKENKSLSKSYEFVDKNFNILLKLINKFKLEEKSFKEYLNERQKKYNEFGEEEIRMKDERSGSQEESINKEFENLIYLTFIFGILFSILGFLL